MLLTRLRKYYRIDEKYEVDDYYYEEENERNGHYYGKKFEKAAAAVGIYLVGLEKSMMTMRDLSKSLLKFWMILMFEKGRCSWVLSGIGMFAVLNYFVILSLMISCMMNSADYD